MTDQHSDTPDEAAERPRFTDKRRIDPQTGQVREPAPADGSDTATDTSTNPAGAPTEGTPAGEGAGSPAEALAAERLEDLQRLQAEYVNYRRRVDRDRGVAREQAVTEVIESLLGVLDDVELARQHGELADGPFASIAEKLETSLQRFGWERYGTAGEPFDPNVHEALMHSHADDVTEPTVVQVLQPGHRVGERVVRAARVAVADPS
ncbi:nucleotide exchange factor GrpE [Cellulomonas bogoriensis]|uniref:Protein GrpE n=1 Tax=Cellulomonas bogoriensis 69B4 = DSM 16987 TaxID=1386082 RepID=A0A0A0BZ48_9CELL|nr:nucleotide exchange factor GrpE [Cellulomonas bogoriensis]KGM13181.1 molecular chaperone GrpE [Cellulomonas bogoriensis 69B4 = DSM 16987]